MRKPRLNVVIPVYNEAFKLRQSLPSVLTACALLETRSRVRCRVVVALDGCRDDSAAVAREFGVELIERTENMGKWRTLMLLEEAAQGADWTVLADAGAVWEQDLLVHLWPYMLERRYVGLAPAYHQKDSGVLGRIHWKMERSLKSLENLAGGPISVHGATVAYDTVALRAVLSELAGRSWQNDDVAIPLGLRLLFADRQLLYLPTVTVRDAAVGSEGGSEHRRRERMVHGNIEWIKTLFPRACRDNPIAALLALRRIFRLLWSYWILTLASGGLIGLVALNPRVAAAAAAGAALAAVSWRAFGSGSSDSGSGAALLASFRAPIYFFSGNRAGEVNWR